MKIKCKKNELLILTEADIYNEDVIHKCFYWYTKDYNVEISRYSRSLFSIRLQSLSGTIDSEQLTSQVKRDLIDFKLRDVVTKETKSIRELIVAKAFAYYGLNDDPITEISDPVGFDPRRVRVNE